MTDKCYVAISKTDVIMENFSNIWELIKKMASNKEKLISSRNTWEVFFTGYDDDPREIPDIPEVVNWIKQSVQAGIPWFYFMNCDLSATGLLTFMICAGAEHAPDSHERYYFIQEKIMPFIKKNMDNLADFADEYHLPIKVGMEATDSIMEFIQNVLEGSADQETLSGNADRTKQFQEALERLSALEELFSLNKNVRKYFQEERLYYSYVTGGGYIGSIDTINYNKQYADIVRKIEEQTSYLVYHVIEHKNTLSLLFISDDYHMWQNERPAFPYVMALVVDIETKEAELGYIKIDSFQGALYRLNDTVYSSLPDAASLSDLDSEVVERLEILKNSGLTTDLDITSVYTQEGEICCSILQMILGIPVCVVNRISANSAYAELLDLLSQQVSSKLYFLIGSTGHQLAFLYISENPSDWETEKLELENGNPYAVVVDVKEMTAGIQQIKYKMVNGGPLFVCD